MTGDPILKARTVTEYLVALNAAYHLDLPSDIPPPGPLSELWAAPVSVHRGADPAVLYHAVGTGRVPLLLPVPEATVFARLTESATPERFPH